MKAEKMSCSELISTAVARIIQNYLLIILFPHLNFEFLIE